MRRALVCLFALAALAGCAPLDDAPPACEAGATRTCARCRAGSLRTNLPGVEACERDDDGGPLAWGPCRCGGPTR
ncbi:MAG: hypothetical protein U0324_46185 [Polyangiales bacterium]